MKNHHIYAVKYIDENGYTISNGYAESMDYFPKGSIIEQVNDVRILIEFEMERQTSSLERSNSD